ncbi:DUF1173 domain-containing protein [Piscinibacter koreensis]|uniref:DUF1173 domain-containing protein n=1 Tax=Piscinibacter koreensis TaxID=2742824 RepID=A0A7Y6NTE2_9BURK|nr:DUF1173 domain-containing protein [Schlegelella koreensis]NUZ08970.1 DUF1173 domain-containing protein [Schlegelella koreensis]
MNGASCEPTEPLEAAGHGAVYLIRGKRFEVGTPGFAEAVASAYAAPERPRCLCVTEGAEMYVARLPGSAEFILKRMPYTGHQHAPSCPSYEPPPEASGLGQVLGSAITENPATGETTLRLDFALSKMPGRSVVPPTGAENDSAATNGTRLSLRGLLHYLWDEAELTRWLPRFEGRRTWGTVRRHLLDAARNKVARGSSLAPRIYIPEVFSVEQREAIHARRATHWASAVAVPGKPQQLMLLIAEVKEIVPARFGFKAVVKHVPDQTFSIDEQLYRRLGRRFEAALTLWGAADDIHMVMIATFGIGGAGVPTIVELSLMPVTRQWLPVEDAFEKQLVERLVAEGRSFVKGLRYNLGARSSVACATLTDCEGSAPLFLVVPPARGVSDDDLPLGDVSVPRWLWDPSSEAMPALPSRAQHGREPASVLQGHATT